MESSRLTPQQEEKLWAYFREYNTASGQRKPAYLLAVVAGILGILYICFEVLVLGKGWTSVQVYHTRRSVRTVIPILDLLLIVVLVVVLLYRAGKLPFRRDHSSGRIREIQQGAYALERCMVSCKVENPAGTPPLYVYTTDGRKILCTSFLDYRDAERKQQLLCVRMPDGELYSVYEPEY